MCIACLISAVSQWNTKWTEPWDKRLDITLHKIVRNAIFFSGSQSYCKYLVNLKYTSTLSFLEGCMWNTLVNYFQIFKILSYVSHSEENLRIFEFTPKVSLLFSVVFHVWFSGALQEEGAIWKGPTEAACFTLKSLVSFAFGVAVCVLSWGLGDENYFRTLFCSMWGS